jgi:COP9 signalosome complex subunit 7
LLYEQVFSLILTFADIIHGKLDQKNSQLEVDYAIGRDIQSDDLGSIVNTLQEWCDSCEAVLSCVETQINRANAEKNRRLKHKEAIEQEVNTCTGTSGSCITSELSYD